MGGAEDGYKGEHERTGQQDAHVGPHGRPAARVGHPTSDTPLASALAVGRLTHLKLSPLSLSLSLSLANPLSPLYRAI